MSARRLALVLGVVAAGCGLGLTGEGPDGTTPFALDGGVGVPEGGDGGAAVSFCDAAKRSDPTVRFCADFDDRTAAAPYGFSDQDTVASGAFSIVGSPFEPTGGAAQVDLLDGTGSRNQRLKEHVTGFTTTNSTRVIADVDVMVASTTTMQYVVLADIEALGQGCASDYRLALQADGLHVGDTVVPVTKDAPFHVRLVGEVTRGKNGTFSATVGDVSVPNKSIFVNDACDTGWVNVGAFFTSTENAHASVRFDHVVVRVM